MVFGTTFSQWKQKRRNPSTNNFTSPHGLHCPNYSSWQTSTHIIVKKTPQNHTKSTKTRNTDMAYIAHTSNTLTQTTTQSHPTEKKQLQSHSSRQKSNSLLFLSVYVVLIPAVFTVWSRKVRCFTGSVS